MKRLLCWLKTIWEFDTFWMVWTTFGAVYVAHEYLEWKNTKHTQTLKCNVCGEKSVATWKGINPFWNSSNSNKGSLKTERNNKLKGGTYETMYKDGNDPNCKRPTDSMEGFRWR